MSMISEANSQTNTNPHVVTWSPLVLGFALFYYATGIWVGAKVKSTIKQTAYDCPAYVGKLIDFERVLSNILVPSGMIYYP
jgi:hypothetical protein